jgi:hypothetical protein
MQTIWAPVSERLLHYVLRGLGHDVPEEPVYTSPARFEVPLDDNPFITKCCPGLAILLASAKGMDAVAREKLDELKRRSQATYTRPLQLALGYIGVGQYDSAIDKLAMACAEHDPFLVWLHLWPMFRPLRGDERFKDLIERMHVPSSIRWVRI